METRAGARSWEATAVLAVGLPLEPLIAGKSGQAEASVVSYKSPMKSTILHDEHGEIIAISKIGDLEKAGSKFVQVGMVPGAGQRVLEIELSEEDGKRPLRELHAEYRVDVATSKLIKKSFDGIERQTKSRRRNVQKQRARAALKFLELSI